MEVSVELDKSLTDKLLPDSPSLFGDVVFCLMAILLVATICHAVYRIIKHHEPIPNVHPGLMFVDFMGAIFMLILVSKCGANGVTHFLFPREELGFAGFCLIMSMLYGFLFILQTSIWEKHPPNLFHSPHLGRRLVRCFKRKFRVKPKAY